MTDVLTVANDRGTNPAAVMLRAVLAHGPLTRDTIAALTGLSPAGVSRQCANLAGLGLLTTRTATRPPSRHRAGRPHTEIDIATEAHTIFGVHIAHHFATLAALDLRGRVRAQEQLPHLDHRPERILARIAARLRVFRQKHLCGRIPVGLGVACGGWVDPDSGVIVEHSSLRWYDVPAGAILSDLTDLPTSVDGHARALACAEALIGAARGAETLVHLFIGNVVDAAIVSAGRLHRGPGAAAGTVAHLPLGEPDIPCSCGRSGCFETEVAERTVTVRAARMSIADVIAAARSGDPTAREVLLRRARTVGRAAALLFDVINPDVLVVTEPGVIHLPECLDVLRAEVSARSQAGVDATHRVLPSSFTSSDVLGVAAGAVQLDGVYTDPHGLSDRLSPHTGVSNV
jgi:predicted NBD/HSP70 family sugar kinase